MPMGGLGSRFSDAGYNTPKPLISVDGMPMFKKAISSLSGIDAKKTFFFVIRKEHVDAFQLDKLIKNILPSAEVIVIPEMTRGAAETAIAAKNKLDPEAGLIIMDCDLWFQSESYNKMISDSLSNKKSIYGGLLTFNSDNPRYSYAKVDSHDFVLETAEKIVISNNAITGAYFFAHAKYFIEATNELLKQHLSKSLKEYYISSLYNIILKNGGPVQASYVDKFSSFGTPEELECYKNTSNRSMDNDNIEANMDIFSGYITDLDGTLCDTMDANLLSYKQAFSDASINFSEKTYRDNFGLRFDNMMEVLAPKATDDQLAIVKSQKAIHYKKNVSVIKPNTALINILKRAKKCGKKVGLATTAREENAKTILKFLNLEDFFDSTIFGEDVIQGKPDPECYKKVINKLNLKAKDCLIFEDSQVGIIAAQSTGASYIKVSI